MEESFELLLQEWRSEINQRLSGLVEIQQVPTLYEPIQYVLDGCGKRIRPALLLLACRAVGGQVSQAWDAAIAVELLHNFTLVHDDIMDQDDTRRGRTTVHKKWTLNTAILSGDSLFALSYRSLLRTKTSNIRRISSVFTDGILAVCEGQALDLEFEKKQAVSLRQYIDMIGKKTAALLDCSARIGAMIGGGSRAEVSAVGAFATNLGLAFQVQDDLLDVTSDEATLGKTHGSDIQQKKQTFLLIHALANAGGDLLARLRRLLKGKIGPYEINEIKGIFEQTGSINAARKAIAEYIAAARDSLQNLSISQEREHFLHLLSYIAGRQA